MPNLDELSTSIEDRVATLEATVVLLKAAHDARERSEADAGRVFCEMAAAALPALQQH